MGSASVNINLENGIVTIMPEKGHPGAFKITEK